MAQAGMGVHRDGEQPVTVAELFIAEAGLFGAEEESDAGGVLRQLGAEFRSGFG